jgi:hypothetical protein
MAFKICWRSASGKTYKQENRNEYQKNCKEQDFVRIGKKITLGARKGISFDS